MSRTLSRRAFIAGAGKAAAAAGLLGVSGKGGGLPKLPNILLIVSDDHGRDSGCYGSRFMETPALDGLAADGAVFPNAFCTAASCSPSRSVILTGRHNHSNGMFGLAHSYHHFSCLPGTATLPGQFAGSGYRTGRVGKKHYAPERIFPFDVHIPDPRNYRDDVAMAENCRAFIKAKGPFFLYFCSHNPHRDGRKLKSHPLKPDRFGNPDKSFPGDAERPYDEAKIDLPPYLTDIPEARAEWAQYCQSVSRLDRGIGRLIEILKGCGKYEDTLIIYISDNGPAFPEAKTTLYDPGMRLPLIVKRPGEKGEGLRCNALVSWTDITPTILDAAGIAPPEGLHGQSFLGITGKEIPRNWRREVYASHSLHEITNYYPMRVVRTERYKFIYNIAHWLPYSFAADLYHSITWQAVLNRRLKRFGERTVESYVHRPKFELYDLEADPGETRNLAGKPGKARLVEEFIGKIRKFQEETRDPWLHKWEYE